MDRGHSLLSLLGSPQAVSQVDETPTHREGLSASLSLPTHKLVSNTPQPAPDTP